MLGAAGARTIDESAAWVVQGRLRLGFIVAQGFSRTLTMMQLVYLQDARPVRAGDHFMWPGTKHRLIVGYFEPPRRLGAEGVVTLFLAGRPKLADDFPVSTIGAAWIGSWEP